MNEVLQVPTSLPYLTIQLNLAILLSEQVELEQGVTLSLIARF